MFFESAVDQALVLVRGPTGQAIGTAFAVDDRGTLLTCHHVVAGLSDLRLDAVSGTPPRCLRVEPVAEYDIALLHTDATDLRPLPLVAQEQPTFLFWTKGFHRIGGSVRGAFPAEGTSIGSTKIVYGQGDTTYILDEAIVLRRDTFDRGLSGSPVLDQETGAVVAMLVGKQRDADGQTGYAIPVRLAMRAEQIAEIVGRNRIIAPAFGRHLNHAGARELCAAQSVAACRDLEVYARIDQTRHVDRPAVHDQVGKFLLCADAVLAIVGPSGNGKSTELTRIASDRSDAVILLSAAMIHPHSRDIAEAVADELRALSSFPLPPTSPADAVAEALRDSSAGLLVLMDAINEAPAAMLQNSRAWIIRSVSWLRRTGARLVLTCRPEYWADLRGVFPTGSLHQVREGDDGPLRTELLLNELNDAESVSALAMYGVPETALDHQSSRHPLMLRLYADLAPASMQRRVRARELLDEYITDQARRVALRRSKPVHRIREAFLYIATKMLATNGYVIDQKSYDEAFSDADTGDAAAAEHVLVRSGEGYRFAFDAVSDALQSEKLDALEMMRKKNLLALIRSENRHVLGPLVYALMRYGDERGGPAIGSLLNMLWQLATTKSDIPLGTVVERVIADLPEASVSIEVLHAIAVNTVAFWWAVDRGSSRGVGVLETWRSKEPSFWAALRLPIEHKLSLLKILLLIEDARGWREKDWARLGRPSLSEWRELAVSTVLDAPVEAIRILVTWLDDVTSLGASRPSEANLGNVAQALMFETRFEHLDDLCDALAATINERAIDLLAVLCTELPGEMCLVVRRWSMSKTMPNYGIAAFCAEQISYLNRPPDELQSLVSAMRNLLPNVRDDNIRDRVLKVLLSSDEPIDDCLTMALDRFRRGSKTITPRSFAKLLPRHDHEIVPVFTDVLETTRDPERAADIITLLIGMGKPDVAAQAVQMARNQLPVLPELARRLSMNLETSLYEGVPDIEHPLAELVRLLYASRETRRPLIYGLTLPHEDKRYDTVRESLLKELVPMTNDVNHLRLIVALCKERPDLTGAAEVVAAIQDRLDTATPPQ